MSEIEASRTKAISITYVNGIDKSRAT